MPEIGENAAIEEGQSPLASQDGRPNALSYYYPGSCLVTARDIITLWVARMLVMGLYNLGDVPFTDCFIHANIQDVFNENGVQIMSPAYVADPDRPKVVPPEHWYAAPAQKPE